MQTYVLKFKSVIRQWPLEKFQIINKRRGTFIPDSRVSKKTCERLRIELWIRIKDHKPFGYFDIIKPRRK